MGPLLSYSMASAIVLAILYLVYKATLSSERQPSLNRIIIGVIYAAAIFVPLSYPSLDKLFNPEVSAQVIIGQTSAYGKTIASSGEITDTSIPGMRILLIIYTVGVCVSFGYLVFSIIQLRRIIKRSEIVGYNCHTIAISSDRGISPFSWLGYIVMSREDYEKAHESIIIHEAAHITHMHCLDVLLSSLVACLQWFNPAAWLMIEELRTVHEYEADEAVIKSGVDIRQYQLLLIKKAVGSRFPSPANSLNQSKIKKRITMMYKTRPTSARRLRALALIPAMAAGLLIIENPSIAAVLSETSETLMIQSSGNKVTKNSADSKAINLLDSQGNVKSAEVCRELNEEDTETDVDALMAEKTEKQSGQAVTPEEKDTLPVYYATFRESDDSEKSQADDDKNNGNVYPAVDKVAEFPGGPTALMRFLRENMKYPAEAQEKKEEGRVIVTFIVTASGVIKDPQITSGVSESIDKEALRVIKAMPAWKPGELKGKKVESTYTIPLIFKLAPEKSTKKQ